MMIITRNIIICLCSSVDIYEWNIVWFNDTATTEIYTDGHTLSLHDALPILQKLFGGLQRSDMIVLAARPSIGKSTFALNLAVNAAKEHANVGIFSLEDRKSTRLNSSH